MEAETKSVIKIGLNNNSEMVINVDYNMFKTHEDLEPLFLIIGSLRKIERQLLNVAEDIEDGTVNDSDDIFGDLGLDIDNL